MGATKEHHVDGAVKALELRLTAADMMYLEEAYVPHALAGVMAQNTEKPLKKSMYGALVVKNLGNRLVSRSKGIV